MSEETTLDKVLAEGIAAHVNLYLTDPENAHKLGFDSYGRPGNFALFTNDYHRAASRVRSAWCRWYMGEMATPLWWLLQEEARRFTLLGF